MRKFRRSSLLHEFELGQIKVYVLELWASDSDQHEIHKAFGQYLPNPYAHICLVHCDEELPGGTNSQLQIKSLLIPENQQMESVLTEHFRALTQSIKEHFESKIIPDAFEDFINNQLDLADFDWSDDDDSEDDGD